ncbi:MAG: permease prefix domain 1-containing protein, partial [Actinomycetes bacterium]
MAGHRLIDAYLDALAGRLPADTVDELADGLIETWHHYVDRGLSPDAAAKAAIAEFGTPHQVNDAFVAQAAGRRTARALLATGPIVGACWAASFITGQAWTWAAPAAVAAAFAVALAGVVGCLLAAATTRHHYRRTHLGVAGAIGLATLDVGTVTAMLHTAPM